MGTAILSVYLDSASDLPQARPQSKPDPFAVLSVGKTNYQTSALKRTDAPVWEQGYSFLVGNPENDTLQIRIVDQKTEKDLGQLTYILSTLLAKNDLQVVSQPFQLQRSGPLSKVTMSLALKILKRSENQPNESVGGRGDETPAIQRQASQPSQPDQTEVKVAKLADFPIKLADYPSQADETVESLIGKSASAVTEFISNESANVLNEDPSQAVRQRQLTTQSSMGYHGWGRIQITLHYSVQRQRLSVTIHKIM